MRKNIKNVRCSCAGTGIGHLKREHRMDRNRLKYRQGDCFNAILSSAGMNFARLLSWMADILLLFFRGYLIVIEHF
jgi:IS5 family transposase